MLIDRDAPPARTARLREWLLDEVGGHAAARLSATALGRSNASGMATHAGKVSAVQQQVVRDVVNQWTAQFVTVLLEMPCQMLHSGASNGVTAAPSLTRHWRQGCDSQRWGANVGALDGLGESALQVAALYGNTDAVDAILRRHPSLTDSRSKSGHSAAELAAIRGRVGTACTLLARWLARASQKLVTYLAVYGVALNESSQCMVNTSAATVGGGGELQGVAVHSSAEPDRVPQLTAGVLGVALQRQNDDVMLPPPPPPPSPSLLPGRSWVDPEVSKRHAMAADPKPPVPTRVLGGASLPVDLWDIVKIPFGTAYKPVPVVDTTAAEFSTKGFQPRFMYE